MRDLLEVYEREEAEARAKVCPVCCTPYEGPRKPGERIIQVITGPDDWDTYACPGCRPDEYPADARRYGDSEDEIRRMLERAARDRSAGRRLTPAEHRAALIASDEKHKRGEDDA